MTFVVCRNLLHSSYSGFESFPPGARQELIFVLLFGAWQLEGMCENWVIDDSVGFAKQDGLNEMPH